MEGRKESIRGVKGVVEGNEQGAGVVIVKDITNEVE